MKYGLFLYSILTLSFVTTASYPQTSFSGPQDKPLMVVRFNNDSIPYENNLGKATKMALAAKSGAFFDVVGISPETVDKRINRQFEEHTKFYVEKIVQQIIQSGVSPEMIRTSYQKNKFTKIDEVQIFVQ